MKLFSSRVGVFLIALAMAALLIAGQQLGYSDSEAEPTVDTAATIAGDAVTFSDLPTVAMAELPPEALTTLDRITNGVEHPYRQDGSVFQNRERILPANELGHYREYTVETPGATTRGARRLVVGAEGERYYTTDHYASFREVTGSG